MKAEQTLKALYEFTTENYESLKDEWNKLPKHEKSKLPLTLFIISVFANLISEYQKKSNVQSIEEAQVVEDL